MKHYEEIIETMEYNGRTLVHRRNKHNPDMHAWFVGNFGHPDLKEVKRAIDSGELTVMELMQAE